MTEQNTEEMVETQSRKYPLAPRLKRLFAVLIDSVLMAFLLAPFGTILGVDQLQSFILEGEIIPIGLLFKMHMGLFVCFLLLNGFLLFRYGQTIGKRLLKIAIATENFQVPEFNRLILFRYLPFFVARAIPGLNLINLVDSILIFREDRRCLHDMIAGTQVIDISQAG